MIKVEELRRALLPWQFEIAPGEVLTASRIMGITEGENIRDLIIGSDGLPAQRKAIHDLFETLGFPVDRVLALEGPIVWSLVTDFFSYQSRVVELMAAKPTSTQN